MSISNKLVTVYSGNKRNRLGKRMMMMVMMMTMMMMMTMVMVMKIEMMDGGDDDGDYLHELLPWT